MSVGAVVRYLRFPASILSTNTSVMPSMYSLVILALAAQQVVAFTAPFGARRSFSSRMMMMSDSEPEAAKEMMSSGGPEVVKESSTEENEIDIDMDSLAEESVRLHSFCSISFSRSLVHSQHTEQKHTTQRDTAPFL